MSLSRNLRPAALTTGGHEYLSTACLHGEHDYCASSVRRDGQPKRPGECKFCAAPCRCPCHLPPAAN